VRISTPERTPIPATAIAHSFQDRRADSDIRLSSPPTRHRPA
jgi:hypothetical protein